MRQLWEAETTKVVYLRFDENKYGFQNRQQNFFDDTNRALLSVEFRKVGQVSTSSADILKAAGYFSIFASHV